VGFIRNLTLTEGRWAGRPFVLLPWQEKIVRDFYGTVREDGRRQYRYLYMEVPKKNGKSGLAAALGLYHLMADGEMGAEVYVCAADRNQASIIYNAAKSMVEVDPDLDADQGGRLQVRDSAKAIFDPASGSVLKVMSSDAFSKHGYKPSCVIFDELHAQPKRDLWDVMTFGAGDAREQPVWIVLTTAGKDPDRASIGWEVHQKALDIRNGIEDNDFWYVAVYGAPDSLPAGEMEAQLTDEDLWFECNPSLGILIDLETVRQDAKEARRSPSKERLFRWLRLNQWIKVVETVWLPLDVFDGCEGEFSPADMMNGFDERGRPVKGPPCFLGFDLGATMDLSAAVLVFPPPDGLQEWRKLYFCWVPSAKVERRTILDGANYWDWAQEGFITVTEGNAVDYTRIEQDIRKILRFYNVEAVGGDQWNSRHITQLLAADFDQVIFMEIRQTIAGMSVAMKQIERLSLAGRLIHRGHPVARYCWNNVAVYEDGNENKKPMKNKSRGRIDLITAEINAMATYISIYGEFDLNEAIASGAWGL
jgi:phage terminase large subunit-like protein